MCWLSPKVPGRRAGGEEGSAGVLSIVGTRRIADALLEGTRLHTSPPARAAVLPHHACAAAAVSLAHSGSGSSRPPPPVAAASPSDGPVEPQAGPLPAKAGGATAGGLGAPHRRQTPDKQTGWDGPEGRQGQQQLLPGSWEGGDSGSGQQQEQQQQQDPGLVLVVASCHALQVGVCQYAVQVGMCACLLYCPCSCFDCMPWLVLCCEVSLFVATPPLRQTLIPYW